MDIGSSGKHFGGVQAGPVCVVWRACSPAAGGEPEYGPKSEATFKCAGAESHF